MSGNFFPENVLPANRKEPAGPRWFRLEQPRIQGIATFEWNTVTGTTWFSEEWENIIQSPYDWTQPSDQKWWDARVHPEDKVRFQRSLLAVYAGLMEAHDLPCRLKRGDGAWLQVLLRSRVTHKTPTGGPWIVAGLLIDLTGVSLPGSHAMADSMTFSSHEYHSMLENSPDSFIRFNRDLLPVYVNPSVCRFLGGARAGRAFQEKAEARRIAGNGYEAFRHGVERVFTKHVVAREEVNLSMTDGSSIVGDCSFWPEFDASGNVKHCMMQFRDITDKFKMEKYLAGNKKRLNALYRLTLMEDAEEEEVLHFAMDSIQELTQSQGGFFFLPEDEKPGRGQIFWARGHRRDADRRYIPSGRLPYELIDQLISQNSEVAYRSIVNTQNGKPFSAAFAEAEQVNRGITAPVMEGERMVCLAGAYNKETDYDETDLLQFESFINSIWLILRHRRVVRELRQTKDAAETANKAKNTFLANVSHELRTPLNGVLSMLHLIDSHPLTVEQHEYLLTAQASSKTLLRIISDILDYSGMESGKMPLTLEVFDFQASVRSSLAMFKENAAAKGLEFIYRIDPAIPRFLLGDEGRVRQIIFNVVGNALKFTAEGSVTVLCSPLTDAPAGQAIIAIEVTDTGIGIPREKLDGVFDAFVQVENTHRRKYGGTGLGLSIVKHLVSMMNGAVSIESELGVGTTVRSVISFIVPDSSCEKPAARVKTDLSKRALDILVAEDDAVGRMAIRIFLQQRGHRVLCVPDGGIALEALQIYPFHCLFTDITMPEMDGLELVRRIRSCDTENFSPTPETWARVREEFPDTPATFPGLRPDITVIAVSAHSMIGDHERFLEQGMDHYIAKPIDRDELDEAIAFAAHRLKDK